MSIKANDTVTLVGSRRYTTTDEHRIEEIGRLLKALKVTGLSGNAEGCDTLWNDALGSSSMIHFLPWAGFGTPRPTTSLILDDAPYPLIHLAEELVTLVHPRADVLTDGPRKLHTRNMFQVLGTDLRSPTAAVIYCAPETPTGKVQGGTSSAVTLARHYGIPAYNLRKTEQYVELTTILLDALNSQGEFFEDY